ncbi:MAG: hypothetical protein EB075_13870, partial [Bacteroidetes bacterium]|nr:hypothetical protein [Bacteroidota bacterium]
IAYRAVLARRDKTMKGCRVRRHQIISKSACRDHHAIKECYRLTRRGPECSICSAAVDSADNKRFRCACQYWYHGACLDRWARISPTCPTCRSAGDTPSPSPSPSPT